MASPNISFDSIPSSIRKPGKYFEFNTKLAVRTLPANLQKTIIVGQKLAAGSQAALTPVDVFSDAQAATYFGNGSIAHLMVRAAIKANPYLALTVIALDDAAAGAAAAGSVTIAGPATASGAVRLGVASMQVDIAVSANDSSASIAAALAAQIANQPDLPISAAVDGVNTSKVNLTAKNEGTLGNEIKLATTINATGVTAVLVAMTGGLNDPDIATALTPIYGGGHHIIITPYNNQTSLTALRTHLDSVSGPLEQRGAIGVYGYTGTLAGSTTLAALINSGRVQSGVLPYTNSLSYELGAAYGAVIASEEDPARPLNTLDLVGIAPPPLANRLSRNEQENMLENGVTPLEVGPGEKVQIVRAITTYVLDPQAIPDISMLDLTTIRTLDFVRKACRERISLRFPREKLSERTAGKVRSELLDVLYKLEELEIVEMVEANKDGVLVERDSQDPNRLNAKIPVDVVNGLHVFAGRIDLLL